MSMPQGFVQKVVLVTGGGTGIGKAAAMQFARRGARVAIAARRPEALEQTVAEIRAAGGDATAFRADIAVASDVESLIASVVEQYGQLDIAFNNAGVMGKWGLSESLTVEDFDQAIGINLRGTWLCCQAEIAQMAKQQTGGAIVNTSSWLAHGALEGSTLYSISKAGLDNMVRALALETSRQGIRINNVNPGVIDTDMYRQNTDEASRKPFIAHTPMGRVGSPEEVAEAVVWLSSDASRFVTGQNLLVDGGYTIPGNRV